MPSERRFNSNNILAGEVVRKGITITKNSGTLNIGSATYAIYDAKDDSVLTSTTDATIDESDVYANISAGSTKGQRYIIFTAVDSNYVIKARLNYDVV